MTEPLKNIYDQSFLQSFTNAVATVVPQFDKKEFQAAVFDDDWKTRELKQRMRHLAFVLHRHLPGTYKAQVATILHIVSGLEEKGVKGGFAYMFLPDFIEQFGQNHLNTSLRAMERLTQFASCEFAIRPFLLHHQNDVIDQMLAWSRHPHPHVRRFASEGCRPRLPWAMAIPALKKDPLVILPILESLKGDDSLFVRRSVANNLNDIAKDHPDVVAGLVKRWKGSSPETDWIIRHGCRTLLKKANASAYALFGLDASTDCNVQELQLSARAINIGDRLGFSFSVKTGKTATKLRLEYAIYYQKAHGKESRKVFQITERTFLAEQTYYFRKEQRFQDFTTRKHYPGKHKLAIVINGREASKKEFLLLD